MARRTSMAVGIPSIDRLASAILEFPDGTATFTCSTQLSPYQRVHIFGTEGRIEIEIPFNAPPDQPCRLWREREAAIEEIKFDVCDQYTIQGDLFAQAILSVLGEPELGMLMLTSDVMRITVQPVKVSDDLGQALRKLNRSHLSRLPVVDEAWKVAGIITREHLSEAYDKSILLGMLETLSPRQDPL